MQRINLNKLYYFYVVAKEGSVKAASQLLNLTQPTISGQIRQLEGDLGFDLFTRKHRKLELNPMGREVLGQAEEIFKLADKLEDISKPDRKQRLVVKIGAIQSLSNSFVTDFSTRMWRDKSIQVEITQNSIPELVRQLNHAEIDLLLADGPLQSSKKYQSVPLGHDKVVAVASPKFKLPNKKFPQNLNDLPYIANASKSFLQEEINYFFERNSIRPEVAGRVDDISLMRVIAQSGTCFAILPRRSVREAVREKKLKVIGELNGVESALWAITPKVNLNRGVVSKLVKDYLKRK